MICRISDLFVDVPAAGDLVSRCQEYICEETGGADIIIRTDLFHLDSWKNLTQDQVIYMESGIAFYRELLKHKGLLLHASAVEVDGKGYLFSGDCGAGKSTHTKIWQATFGEAAQVFNDDKPALRCLDGKWYAYGTPWCGKDGINQNKKVPLAGICFLKQAGENKIRRLSQRESVQNILAQTLRRFRMIENLDLMTSHVGNLVMNIPVFELENRPEPEAAHLSYETMRRAAEELGL